MANIEIHVADTAQELAEEAAKFFIEHANESIKVRGEFIVALSGGNTPATMFDAIAKNHSQDCDWTRVHFFWSDERLVPPDSERSNYHTARVHLLDKIDVPPGNIHRATTADSYDKLLRKLVHHFDVIYLGIGEDGHTASLFPGNPALKNVKDFVTAASVPGLEDRITFTYPLINAAEYVVVLASGKEKSEIIRATLKTPRNPEKFPIQGVHPKNGKLVWFLDRASAASACSS